MGQRSVLHLVPLLLTLSVDPLDKKALIYIRLSQHLSKNKTKTQLPYYPTAAEPKFSGIDSYQEKHVNENYGLQSPRAPTDLFSLFFYLFNFQSFLKKPLVSHLNLNYNAFWSFTMLRMSVNFYFNDSCSQTPGSSVSTASLPHTEFLEVRFNQVLQ